MVPDAVLEHAAYPITIDPTVSSGQLVSPPSNRANQPSVAFDGEDYLVAWSEYDGSNFEIRAAQVNGAGTIVQPIGFLSTQGDSRRRPTTGGGLERHPLPRDVGALVQRQRHRCLRSHRQPGRLSRRRGRLGRTRRSATRRAPRWRRSAPRSSWCGATTALAPATSGARASNTGAVLDAFPGVTVAATANAETQPDIAATSGALLVSYQFLAAAGNPDVYAQRTNLSLVPVGTAIPLATTAAPEQDAKVASDGSGYLVVWGGPGDIQGRRVLTDGSLPGAAVIPISSAPDNQSLPDVAFNGVYLVAWKDNRNFRNEIWAARVASNGTVQDASGFRIFDQTTNMGTAGIFAPPSVAPGPGSNWAVDHEAVFGGIFHYSVAPK